MTTRAPREEEAHAITDLVIACDIDEFGAPDFELDRLNHQRRDLIVRGFRYAEQGDFDTCFSMMDRVIEVTDQMTARLELLMA